MCVSTNKDLFADGNRNKSPNLNDSSHFQFFFILFCFVFSYSFSTDFYSCPSDYEEESEKSCISRNSARKQTIKWTEVESKLKYVLQLFPE